MSDIEDEYDAYYSPLDLEGVNLSQNPPRVDSFPPADSEPASQPTALETSDDEFDAYDFSEFTAADFAKIDAALLPSATTTTYVSDGHHHNGDRTGGPVIEIKLEQEADNRSDIVKAPQNPRYPQRDPRSPLDRFRKWKKYFSVSDLVGPAWCEVQFDYGLRQKRHLAPEQRPDTFVTDEGKTITVDKSVAQENNRVVTRGQSVHKVLEREVMPEQVLVEITTPEERWGIRLVNMLACLQSLMQSGLCREMPVFGIVHDQIVLGIIDELVRKPALPSTPPPEQKRHRGRPSGKGLNKRASPSTPTKGNKKSRTTPEPSQPQLTSYFHMAVQVPERDDVQSAFAVCSPAGSRLSKSNNTSEQDHADLEEQGQHVTLNIPSSWMLHISDTKTRRAPSLPPEEDTLPSRLQLMLYHRLLSSLLCPASPKSRTRPKSPSAPSLPPPIDFPTIWKRLGVNPKRPFSSSFMREAGLEHNKCLADLATSWHHAVEALHVSGIDRTLTLVYRLQPTRVQRTDTAAEREAVDLARAIEASLNEAPRVWAGGDDQLARAIEESVREVATGSGKKDALTEAMGAVPDTLTPSAEELDEEENAVRREATDATEKEEQASAREPSADSQDSDSDGEGVQITAADIEVEARILGSREFAVDDKFLDDYLDSILQWWLGRRPPKGVDIELTRRCLNCEYFEGCEWRAKKAMEMQEAASKS
ncbi:hypothetical protein DAEQUDRAFT_684244 [Daedalea quercina L-15889]|uniref:Uncharacterized protein n=1 Tax=Daedalea quercina L-15889 TaxID=1314783 RepID=A0A165TDT2_9APHY|nr:hypothetical protein DAEQUDRAFT_684244 [Daedalea quercina L-15889]